MYKKKKTLVMFISVVLLLQLFLPSIGFTKGIIEYSDIGYPFYYAGISTDGFFQMMSSQKEISEFRDLKTGRLLHQVEHNESFQNPYICYNKYILTDIENIDSDTVVYTMIDRDGKKLKYKKSIDSELILFDDEFVELIIKDDSAKGEIIVSRINQNKEIIWERTLQGQRVHAQNYPKHHSFRKYLWITNFSKSQTEIINPADGKTVTIFDYYLEKLYSNGQVALCIMFAKKDWCLKVINLETEKIVWESLKRGHFRTFVDDNKATIIFATSPKKCFENIKLEVFVVDKDDGSEEKFTFTIPSTYYTHPLNFLKIYDARGYYICYQSLIDGSVVLKDARINRIIWKSEVKYGCRNALFFDDYLLIPAIGCVKLLDLNTLDVLWKFNLTHHQIVAEYEGLEYVKGEDSVVVRDIEFDVIEPYEYDISDINGYAEYIPTKYGLLAICATGNNNNFNDIRLMRPGIEEPVYSYSQQSGWMKKWERVENEDYIKLIWKFHGTKIEERTWYLHIPTGITLPSIPKE
jgi:hypothetical protein